MYNNGKIDLVDHVQSSDFKSYFNTLPPLFPQTTILNLTYCKISHCSFSQFAMVNALASYRYNLNLIMCETIWWSPAWARGILRAPRLPPNHWLPCANIRAHEANTFVCSLHPIYKLVNFVKFDSGKVRCLIFFVPFIK